MTFVRQIAQTVTVLDEGKILCEGTADAVMRDPRVIEVYLGEDREHVPHPVPVAYPHHANGVVPVPHFTLANQ